jgi:transcriptional antiterminator RfaH
MDRWYAVKTQPRREFQVDAVLSRRDVEVFLPRIQTRRDRRPSHESIEPLFAGYLFARLDVASSKWLAARSAPGVAYFLGCEGVPSPLPDDLVEGIRARVEARERQPRQPQFNRGDRLTITDGPLYGLEVIFESRLSASGRVRAFLQVLNRLIPLDINANLLSRVGPPTGGLSLKLVPSLGA